MYSLYNVTPNVVSLGDSFGDGMDYERVRVPENETRVGRGSLAFANFLPGWLDITVRHCDTNGTLTMRTSRSCCALRLRLTRCGIV